jgi:hypothetical protein
MLARSRSEGDVPITHSITGIKELETKLNSYAIDAERAITIAFTTAVVDIAGEADTMIPVDEGILRASQDIDFPKLSGRTLEATISYGGPSAPYALVQHENADLWHPPKPPGKRKVGGRSGSGPTEPGNRTFGGPKYLEYPFDRETETWPNGFKQRLIAAGMMILKEARRGVSS